MLTMLKVDLYKFLKSNIVGWHLVIPMLGLLLMSAYLRLANFSHVDQVFVYTQVITMAFPLVISLMTTMMYEQEVETNFYNMLTTSTHKIIPHLSKLSLLLSFGLISTILSFVSFGFIQNNTLELATCFKVALLLWGSNIPLYMLQYLVVFTLGKGASLGVGIVGSLISALMMTGLGDMAWMMNMWAYGVRLSYYFLHETTSGPLNITLQRQCTLAMCFMISYSIIGLIGIIILSRKWEGGNKDE